MGSTNTDNAIITDKQTSVEKEACEKTIYIGVFFDGTGNNKFQVMLGKLFRGKEAVSNVKRPDGKTMTIGEVRAKSRGFWENGENKGTFTKSQLDELFFGYETVQCGDNEYFIEDSKHWAPLVGRDDTNKEKEYLEAKSQMLQIERGRLEYERKPESTEMDKEVWEDYKDDHSGGDAQNSTYTNVAILEALYKTEKDYYPIYAEGVGTNMVNGKINLWSGGTGRGDDGRIDGEGVFSILEKAVNAVSRVAEKCLAPNISKLHIKMSTYGFSRGATEARMFSFVYSYGHLNGLDLLEKINLVNFLKNDKYAKELNFVGIFDTVASVLNYNTKSLGLYAIDTAEKVLHLCAMDEYRYHFPLTDIRSAYSKGLELFLPGCHTDIGGGTDIGVDRYRQIYNYADLAKCFLNKWNHNNSDDYAVPSVEVLKEMGWLPEGAVEDDLLNSNKTEKQLCEKHGAIYIDGAKSVSIKKYVKPGYTNIPLHLMKESVSSLNVFNEIPYSYGVCVELSSFYDSCKKMLGKTGQHFVSLTNDQYKMLRTNYLHYSGNDQFSTNGAVNSVNLEKIGFLEYLITRLIIVGVNSDKESTYFLSHLN